MEKILQVENIVKTFGPVRALQKGSVNIYKGKVMGLIGENGAGKSTIIKCISGIHKIDSGKILINGENIVFKKVKDAERLGIAVVHQELQLADNISVAENIFLGRLKSKFGFISPFQINKAAKKYLKILNLAFTPETLVSDLSIANQQMVEIARALSMNAKIIILDEPTDSLSEEETLTLFKTIKKLKKSGVSFLYVTHRMKELHTITDHTTVFRDGSFVKEVVTAKTSLDQMIKLMIGRDLNERFPQKVSNLINKPVKYKFENFTNKYVTNVSLDLKEGEIVGLAGLIGSGRTEFVRSIIADLPKTSGTVSVRDIELRVKSIKDAIGKGIYYVSENRKLDGLDVNDSIRNNIIISSYSLVQSKLLKIVQNRKITKVVNTMRKKVVIKLNSQFDPVSSLSGGNQQKVLLAKALLTKPKLLILDEPTRGVDIGARKEIYQIMRDITSAGTSILMISSEMPEAIGMSDRIAVFHEGTVAGILEKKDFSEDKIIALATKVGGEHV